MKNLSCRRESFRVRDFVRFQNSKVRTRRTNRNTSCFKMTISLEYVTFSQQYVKELHRESSRKTTFIMLYVRLLQSTYDKDRKCAVDTLVQSRNPSNVNTIASNNKRFVQHESYTMRSSTPNLVLEAGGSLTDTDCPACNRDLVLLRGYPSNNRLLQDLSGARLELTSNSGLQAMRDYKASFHKTRILLNNL